MGKGINDFIITSMLFRIFIEESAIIFHRSREGTVLNCTALKASLSILQAVTGQSDKII